MVAFVSIHFCCELWCQVITLSHAVDWDQIYRICKNDVILKFELCISFILFFENIPERLMSFIYRHITLLPRVVLNVAIPLMIEQIALSSFCDDDFM